MQMMIDKFDERLIELLAEDARQTSSALGKRLGVNPATVRRRVRRLTQSKLIRIIACTNPETLGYSFRAVVAFDVYHDKLDSIIAALNSMQEVRWLSATTGRFDLIVTLWFHSSVEYYHFMQSTVTKLEGVKDTETFVCVNSKKDQ